MQGHDDTCESGKCWHNLENHNQEGFDQQRKPIYQYLSHNKVWPKLYWLPVKNKYIIKVQGVSHG